MAEMDEESVKRTRCPKCRGTGIDPSLHQRYTSGGHNDRACPLCNGECYLSDEPKRPADEEKVAHWSVAD